MDYTEKDFGKILKHNALQMRRLMLKNETDCMRVYDRNLEAFPVTVDLYGPYARITDYSIDGMDDDRRRICCDIAARMLYVQADHVVFHQRKKRQGREQHDIQSEESLFVPVKENGLSFTVDLTKRIDTGLFLDHVETRALVRDISSGMSVLNLFAYTGSFSVYAASGGAKKVVSVDMSATYSEWCAKNLKTNGFVGEEYPCVAEDAWKYIRRAAKNGEKYDLIIFDPPSFSNSRKMEHDFDVQRDHVRWIRLLNRLLVKDGLLLFSTNLGTFIMDKRSIRGYDVQEISAEVAAPGFSKLKGCTRSWMLKKEHEVQIPAEDLREPEVPVMAAMDAEEETAKTVQDDARDVQVEQVEEEKQMEEMENKTPEDEMDVVESVEEVQQESVEQDAAVAEDLLTLDWNDDDVVAASDEEDIEDDEMDSEDLEDSDSEDTEGSSEPKEERPRKERWSAERRNGGREGGRDRDRRDGGRDRDDRRSYGDRDSRPRYNDDRRSSSGNDRGGERRSYGDRDSRPRYNDDRRPSYGGDRGGERRSYGDRDDRSRYNDRPRYNDDKPRYGSDRPRYNDDRKPSYGGGRDGDRRSYGDRDSRPRYNDDRRSSYGGSRDGERRSYGDRDSRPRYNDEKPRYNSDRPRYSEDKPRYNSDRPSYGEDRGPSRDRDDRRSYGDRDSRPRYNDDRRSSYGGSRDGDRRSYGDRDRKDDRPFARREGSDGFKPRRYDDNGGDRRPWGDSPRRDGGFRREGSPRKEGGFRRDDRKGSDAVDRPRTKGPKPYGFDKFSETRTRGQEEDTFFWLSDDEKN